MVGPPTIENQIKEDDTTICAGLTVAAFLYTHSVVRNPLPAHQTQWIWNSNRNCADRNAVA